MIKTKFEDSELTIRVPLNQAGTRSRSGSTYVIGTSQGNQYIGDWNGKPTYLQVNVLQSERDIQTKGRDEEPLKGVVDIETRKVVKVRRKKPAGRVRPVKEGDKVA